ncbi:MAG TPA: VOC family protein [Kribbella sp.]|nr:VOC family protein [Kribbella sp.]
MLEVVVLPVADVDRSKAFYEGLGFQLDADITSGDDVRVVRLTPPWTETSVVFGVGVTTAEPGSVQGVVVAVADIVAARADLVSRGLDVSEISTGADRLVTFKDLDSNVWILQRVRQSPPDADAPRRQRKWRWSGPSSSWLSWALAGR